jgi:serine/threonine protein kinase
MLELHNAQWLHKDLHSDNVIFFSSSNIASKHTDKITNIELTNPYICGFEYARPDQVSAISFDVRKSSFNFYRHPSLSDVDTNGKRPRYEKKHDIYSLGLLLLEIGLWQPLKVFYKEGSDTVDFGKKVKSLAIAELPHRVGEGYKDVVLRCLSGDGLGNDSQEGDGDSTGNVGPQPTEDPDLAKFYWLVVRELEKCHCT